MPQQGARRAAASRHLFGECLPDQKATRILSQMSTESYS